MSFTNPYSTKTAGSSTITASETNAAGVSISRAVDGTGGGDYSPGTVIGIGSAGLRLNATSGAASNLQLASRAGIVRHQSMHATSISGNWSLDNTPALAWRNTAAGGTLWISIDRLPHGQQLDNVTVRWKGVAGAHAADLANITKPTIRVFRVDSSGVETGLAAATSDPSTTSAGYEAYHDITTGGLSHSVDLTLYRYYVAVIGELGAGFTSGAHAISCKVSCTITGYTEY